MSTPPKKIRSRRARLLAFAPALVCIGVTAFVASGVALVPGAAAVTSIDITGTVTGALAIDTTPGGAGCPDPDGAGPLGNTIAFAAGWESSPTIASGGNCTITYGTNYGPGAEVTFKNANTGTDPFCTDPDGAGALARCAGGASVANVTGVGQTLNGGTNRFGIALTAVAGDGGNTGGSGVSAPAAAAAGTAQWAPIPTSVSAAAQLCHTTGTNASASCSFALGVNGQGAGQPAGTYDGRINFTTTSL